MFGEGSRLFPLKGVTKVQQGVNSKKKPSILMEIVKSVTLLLWKAWCTVVMIVDCRILDLF